VWIVGFFLYQYVKVIFIDKINIFL
jgi:hypothetical protein